MSDQKKNLGAVRSDGAEEYDKSVVQQWETLLRFFGKRAPLGTEPAELVNETVLRLLQARNRWEGRSSFRVFALAVAANVLSESYRRANTSARFTSSARDLEQIVDEGNPIREADVALDAPGVYARVEAAFQNLPREDRMILRLQAEGMTSREIAEQLGVHENTLRSRTRRIRERLRYAIGHVPPSSLSGLAGQLEHFLKLGEDSD